MNIDDLKRQDYDIETIKKQRKDSRREVLYRLPNGQQVKAYEKFAGNVKGLCKRCFYRGSGIKYELSFPSKSANGGYIERLCNRCKGHFCEEYDKDKDDDLI